MTIGDVPRLVIVTTCCGDVSPSATSPKSNEVGLIESPFSPTPLNASPYDCPFQVPPVEPVAVPTAVGRNA